MTTRRDQVDVLRACQQAGQKAAVAVVIWTDGSVYRRAGARSVVTEDGRIVGLISGGCAEQDLLEHARSVWETGIPARMDYDFRGPDDLIWGMGSGCNGALTIWMAPFDPARGGPLADQLLADATARASASEPFFAVSVVQSADVERVAMGPLDPASAARALAEAGKSLPLPVPGAPGVLVDIALAGVEVQLFVEHVDARAQLCLVGAGDDALLLAQFASLADWRVEVVDHRADWLTERRIPWADERRVIARDEYDQVSLAKGTYVVIMTHQYAFDKAVLTGVLGRGLPYVALLGPRRRCERLLEELAEAGHSWTRGQLACLHSPAGLDTGAETPEEIALSILTEAMACRRGRTGGELRARVGELPSFPVGGDFA